jgi:hypothetical protein
MSTGNYSRIQLYLVIAYKLPDVEKTQAQQTSQDSSTTCCQRGRRITKQRNQTLNNVPRCLDLEHHWHTDAWCSRHVSSSASWHQRQTEACYVACRRCLPQDHVDQLLSTYLSCNKPLLHSTILRADAGEVLCGESFPAAGRVGKPTAGDQLSSGSKHLMPAH